MYISTNICECSKTFLLYVYIDNTDNVSIQCVLVQLLLAVMLLVLCSKVYISPHPNQ